MTERKICQMGDSLILVIRKAIENCTISYEKMKNERNEVINVLNSARYLDASTLHLVERQYNEKISNVQQDIADMEAHMKELESND
jgi:hypothetical protein